MSIGVTHLASRDLIYRVSIQTNDARRAAANVRSVFERELRQITLSRLDTSPLTRGVVEAQRLRTELGRAAQASRNIRPPSQTAPTFSQLPANTSFLTGGIDDAINQVKGLAASYLGLQGVIAAIDLSKLGTQALRTYASLNILSGGAQQTKEVLEAIQKASNGTVTELEAAGIATQGFALKLARTPAEFEKLTRAAREIVQVSPIINDVSEALTQLALFASNEQSFARADQLGLAVGEVKDRMAELRRENDALSGSQAKLLASIQLLDEKYGATLNTVEAQASGIERLRVAWEDARVSFATSDFGFVGELFSVDKFANSLATAIEIASGNYTKMEAVIDSVGRSVQFLENRKNAFFFPEDTTAQIDQATQRLELYKKVSEEITKAVASGVPEAGKYQAALDSISDTVATSGVFTDEQIAKLQELSAWYSQAALSVVKLSEAEKLRADNKITADQFENVRQATIFEQQPAIDQALANRAGKAASTVGIEQAIATYRQQKALVDQAIQQLIDSGVTDQNEIAIRVANIVTELSKPFDELEARASAIDLSTALGNFDQVGTALNNINASFTDFLPGVASAREELATLSAEMALTGQLTDEQAARLDYLSAVAYSVADGGSQLNNVVAELGSGFLESNAYAAELVNQLFLAEAAFRNGQISADIYAGVTAALTGKLLTLAQGAGIATNAIYALNSAQSNMASPAGLAIGGSIANRIQTTQQSAAREQNRREMERYNRDLARSQERSASRAGKLLEDGAKRANQELKAALDKVPGLFGTTQVTEQDMKDAELGVYQEKADEYLRRLRDEIQNGHDWEDVSLEEARAGLERAGLEVGSTAEATLAMLERSINDSSLFSAAENIPIFINEEAVKLAQDLQSKSEEGRKNIYEYFGVQVDEAVDAATGGGGGGAGIKVEPPKLVDIDPLTAGLQTGLDEYVNANGEMVKEQLAKAQALFFDPADLFGAKGAGGKPGAMGPITNPQVTVTADPAAQAWLPVLTGQGAAPGAAGAQVSLSPTMDLAAIEQQLTNFKPKFSLALADDAGQQLVYALGDQLSKQVDALKSHGAVVGRAFLIGLQETLSVDAKGNAKIDFAGFIGNNLNAQAQTFIAQGGGIGSLLKQGLDQALQPAQKEGETATGGISVKITEIAVAEGARAPDISVLAKIDKFAIDQTALYDADLSITPTVDLVAASEEREKLKRTLTFSIEPGLFITEADRLGLQSSIESIQPTIQVALAIPEQQVNADGSQGANAITSLLTGINTQIRTQQDGIKREGSTIAQIIMAGIIAHFQAGQQSGGAEGGGAATPIADALLTAVSTQFSTMSGTFYAAGFGPAGSVESGFKAYQYDGLSAGLLGSLTNSIRADADAYMQRGATIAQYVQKGINDGFTGELGIRSAILAGGAWGTAFMQGALDAISAAGFADQIATQVVDSITAGVEQP